MDINYLSLLYSFIIIIIIIRFNLRGTTKLGLSKTYMYAIIIGITCFHWFIALMWMIFKKISVVPNHTNDYKEYQRCKFPMSKNIRYVYTVLSLK